MINRDLYFLYKQNCKYDHKTSNKNGFTIVELLIVIVVIGILAAITLVAYSGISSRANLASAQSDLSNATTQLKAYYIIYGAYPVLDANNCPAAPSTVDNNYCLKVSNGNTLTYSIDHKLDGSNDYTDFGLTIKSNATNTYFTNGASDLKCPSNFIIVPGSATYGTNDFCVMKYEASQVGSTTTPISQPNALPWVNISQTTAIANAPNVAGCTGCHLITEAEWMTLAQNVLSVASNWSGGAVGTGYIYQGSSDNAPSGSLAADPNDVNGYAGTGNVSPSNQKRTLTLTNGEVIWDLSGNVWEWTTGQTTGGQPGITGEVGYAYKQWVSVNAAGALPPPSPFPGSTGLTGSAAWTSTQGIGQLYSYVGEVGLHAFFRGGDFNDSSTGILALSLSYATNSGNIGIGFRVSR